MTKAMIITVGTGKDRKDIASAICKSIDSHNPDEIIFICSEKSKTETMPHIQCDERLRNKKFSCELTSDEDDLEKIKMESSEIIKKMVKVYGKGGIIVDYTSGTKAMSAGLILAAIENEIACISYISGKRNSEGRVISGGERIISFSPNEIYANKLFFEAINSFNRYQYNLSIDLLKRAVELFQDQKFIEKTNILSRISNAYFLWDRFLLEKTLDVLKGLPDSSLCSEWGIKNKIRRHKEIVYKEVENKFCEERIADLFLNAKRRHEEGKYDDAVARLYRLLEYVAQFRIASNGFYQVKEENKEPDTSKLALNKIPGNLRGKYTETIGLEKSYELLNDLKDPIGIKIFSELRRKDSALKSILVIRNNSILAHGFSPVKEERSEKLFDIIKQNLVEIFSGFDSLLKDADFPHIKI